MQIQSGTAAVTNGSSLVTASDLNDWTQAKAGSIFVVPGGTYYTIASVRAPGLNVSGRWELNLTAPYSGTTNAATPYGIHVDFTPEGIPILGRGDTELLGLINRMALKLIEGQSAEAVNLHTSQTRTKLVWAGDSLTAEDWEKPTIPTLLSQYASGGRFLTVNVGYSGAFASELDLAFATQVAPHAPVGQEKAILCLLIGTNDINAGTTAAATYNLLKSIWAKARALGFEVCAMTLFGRQDWAGGSAKDNARIALNDLIRGTPSLVHYIVNLDRLIPVWEWTLFTNAAAGLDQIHLGLEGRKLAARAVWDAMHQRQPFRNQRFRVTLGGNRTFAADVATRLSFDAIPVESPPCIAHDGGPDILIPGDYAFFASIIGQFTPGTASAFMECQLFIDDVFFKRLGRVQGLTAGVQAQAQIGGSCLAFNLPFKARVNLKILTNNAAGCSVVGGMADFEGYRLSPDRDIPTV